MIYQQVTLSGDDEWPKVADAMIEAEEIIFSLKHYWRFVDCEALELKALSQGVDEKAA